MTWPSPGSASRLTQSGGRSNRGRIGLTGADAHNLRKVCHKDLSVTNLAGAGSDHNLADHRLSSVDTFTVSPLAFFASFARRRCELAP